MTYYNVGTVRKNLEDYIECLGVYKFLSKQEKKDLTEYLNNSNYIHHDGINRVLQDAQSTEYVSILKKYIGSIEARKYIRKYSLFYEEFRQNEINVIQAKPHSCGLDLMHEYNGFYLEGINILFLTESFQYLVLSKNDFTNDMWKHLNNITSWKKFTFKAKFNYSNESTHIRVDVLIN